MKYAIDSEVYSKSGNVGKVLAYHNAKYIVEFQTLVAGDYGDTFFDSQLSYLSEDSLVDSPMQFVQHQSVASLNSQIDKLEDKLVALGKTQSALLRAPILASGTVSEGFEIIQDYFKAVTHRGDVQARAKSLEKLKEACAEVDAAFGLVK